MTKGREAIYIEPNNMAQIERMRRYYQMIAKQTGRSVRPFRGDGYVNLVTQLGNNRNNQAPVYRPELLPSDTELAALYEGSGLFSKIIDAPAEEAIKHGFELQDVTDAKINDFISEALDELEWENTAATAIKWSRLFGGSIIVMLIDDGRGIDEPLDWKNIKSIDELRVFERAIVVPDETSMYRYVPGNPLGGNRYGEPEFYTVSSRYGFFNVHESRCLVFRNGRVPEFSANSIYQLWGIPEYVRMKQALANSELAYGSAPKMLERCVQAVYKMKNLAEELSTEDGEQNVLKRLEVIDLARGLLNSIAIDNEGEDYDFKTFSFTGVADVIDSTCNMLSAVSNIPQTILFGRSPAGMNATGTSDLENWYNYIERVQKTQVKKNLRYLLSVIFQAGMYHGEIDEIPKIKISFNPLWSLSEQDKANVDKVKADTELVRANTANLYIQADVISSDEVRSALAKTDEFDIETMLDDMEDDENLMTSIHDPVSDPDGGEGEENSGADVTDNTDPTAPDATKNPAESAKANLPTEPKRSDGNDYDDFPEYGMWLEEHMEATREEQKAAEEHYKALKKAGNRQHSNRDNQSTKEQKTGGVGVIVVKDGKILCGKRHNDTGYGLLCGPGGHVEHGETVEQAAIRETQEEFGITPKNIIQLGYGPKEPETGIAPAIFLCTEYDGEPKCDDLEMVAPQFLSLDELEAKAAEQYQPFKDGVVVLLNCLNMNHDGDSAFFGGELNSIKPGSYDVMRPDGGEGSGNFGHKGRPGEIGGSAESHQLGGMKNGELASKMKDVFGKAKVGTHFSIQMEGPVGKEAYEAFKTSDGYYLRSKKGSNRIISSDDKLVEGCGVYVVEATKNRTMYKKADIQIGEPETDEAKKFAEDYASFQKAKERLQAGETQISEVSDDVAKQYADTLNKASKGKIAKIAAEDPQFKAVVDNISAYTQGEYIFQRKTVEGVVENGYDPSKDAILGDRLTDSAFSCKDMYQGQNLSVSSASVAEGMTNLTKAVKCSEPYEGELYRVAQDRSILLEQDSGRQGVYVPPVVGETIKITAPTSFSKDRAAVDKIAKDKMGDIIYYTVEPGAHAVDVSKLSPYKQAELLSCGDYEVVKVESEPRTSMWDREDKFTSETLETLKQHRGATVSDGYVTYPVLTTHITLRQTSSQNSDSADDNRTPYRLDDFSERMVQSTETDGGPGSGNWGHQGVEGQVGGSAPGGGAHNRLTDESGKFTSFAKNKKKFATPHKTSAEELGAASPGTKVKAGGMTWVKENDWDSFTCEETGEFCDYYDLAEQWSDTDVKLLVPDSDNHNFQKIKSMEVQTITEERRKNAANPATEQEADDLYRDQSGKVWQKLSADQKDALVAYTSNAYRDINGRLRGGADYGENTVEQIENITSAISQSRLQQDSWFQRGVREKAVAAMFGLPNGSINSENIQSLIGMTGKDNGFMSCGSTSNTGFTQKNVQLKIFAPAGTKALYAEPFSECGQGYQRSWDGKKKQTSFSYELETIIQRGSSFQCTNAKANRDGSYELELLITGQDY